MRLVKAPLREPSSGELSVLRPALTAALVVEAGFHDIARRVHEVLNHTGNFINAQSAGPGQIDEGGRAIVRKSKAFKFAAMSAVGLIGGVEKGYAAYVL